MTFPKYLNLWCGSDFNITTTCQLRNIILTSIKSGNYQISNSEKLICKLTPYLKYILAMLTISRVKQNCHVFIMVNNLLLKSFAYNNFYWAFVVLRWLLTLVMRLDSFIKEIIDKLGQSLDSHLWHACLGVSIFFEIIFGVKDSNCRLLIKINMHKFC